MAVSFREKLVNASTGEIRQGNPLEAELRGEVETITIDGEEKDIQYYYVHCLDGQWRKSTYYEVLADKHVLRYLVNGEQFAAYSLRFGDRTIVPEYNVPGYEWSGWNETIPSLMPDNDLTITSTATAIDYNLVYYIDNEVVHFEVHNVGDTLTEWTAPARDGYRFGGWTGFPENNVMPAQDVDVTGRYVTNSTYFLTYYLNGT